MYRVWYSTESFADYIIANTCLAQEIIAKNRMYESDANNPSKFHTMPDHIRKILYLDAPDIIVEKDKEPIFSIEISTEAGTGHNAFQRFARIAASVENEVPAFYIYPEGVVITRKGAQTGWDKINPMIFKALDSIMSIYDIPALLYYFPSDLRSHPDGLTSPNIATKGLIYDQDIINYPGCPDATDIEMLQLFSAINETIESTKTHGAIDGRTQLLRNLVIRERKTYMQSEYFSKIENRSFCDVSPVSATEEIPTQYLLNFLSQFETHQYNIGELLQSRNGSILYQVNAKFRGDPYPGALAAIDYLLCREGKTYEDRKNNLVLVFGNVVVDHDNGVINITDENGSSILDFFRAVKNSEAKNLLTKDYSDLDSSTIPRYYMQVRYGSTYSKVKHIRVYSYFADAILFPDGSLWRDA